MSGATIKFEINIPTETVQTYMDGLVRIQEAKAGKSFDWSTLLSAASFAAPVIAQMFTEATSSPASKVAKAPQAKVVKCPVRDPETGRVPQEFIDECRAKGVACPMYSLVKSTDEDEDVETDEVVYGAETVEDKATATETKTAETKSKPSYSEESLPENMFTMFMNPEQMGALMGNLKPLLATFRDGFDIVAQTDAKLADTKPAESKTADTKTVESKPADTKPAEETKDTSDTKPKTE